MYSNIIQIGTEVIGKEDFINALTLYEGGYGFFDYCSEVLEAYRKIVIEDFLQLHTARRDVHAHRRKFPAV